MKHLNLLLKGELSRLVKYNIALVGVVVSLMWVAAIAMLDATMAPSIAAMLVFADAGMMSVLLLIAAMYFEKQEGTLRTTLITPCKTDQILVAKVLASVVLGLVSGLIIGVSVVAIHGTGVNFLLLVPAVVCVVLLNSMISFIISIFSRDFNNMLVNYMVFVMVFILPSMLVSMGVFGQVGALGEWLLLISPLHACQVLINSAFTTVSAAKLIVSFVYAIVATASLYLFVVRKRFKKYAIGD